MNFEDALAELKKGRRVRRPDMNKGSYIRYDETQKKFRMKFGKSSGQECNVVFNSEDVLEDEWEVVTEGKNIQWALDRLKQGFKVRRLANEQYYWQSADMIMTRVNCIVRHALMGSEDLMANDWVLYEGGQQ